METSGVLFPIKFDFHISEALKSFGEKVYLQKLFNGEDYMGFVGSL